MGWSGGSELGRSFWEKVRTNVRSARREETARALINALEDMDCDTIYECEQLVIDAKLEDEYFAEEEEE